MLAGTFTVIVELPPPGALIVAGAKVIVTPAGAPTADSAIGLLKPLETLVETGRLACPPSATNNVGAMETEKFGVGVPPVSCIVQAFLVTSLTIAKVSRDGKYPKRPLIPRFASLNVPSGFCG